MLDDLALLLQYTRAKAQGHWHAHAIRYNIQQIVLALARHLLRIDAAENVTQCTTIQARIIAIPAGQFLEDQLISATHARHLSLTEMRMMRP